jgi:phosphate-selective porin OprO/OprP
MNAHGDFMRRFLVASLLAGTALATLSTPGLAQSRKASTPPQKAERADPRIGVLEQQLRDIQQQLGEIKRTQGDSNSSAALADLKRSTSAQYTDINNQLAGQTKVGIANGRPTFTSADGAFSLALRSLVQFDAGYFSQGRNPANVDLNSGTNFRRAQLGFQGTVFRDWGYNFIYDFGGNGVENRG